MEADSIWEAISANVVLLSQIQQYTPPITAELCGCLHSDYNCCAYLAIYFHWIDICCYCNLFWHCSVVKHRRQYATFQKTFHIFCEISQCNLKEKKNPHKICGDIHQCSHQTERNKQSFQRENKKSRDVLERLFGLPLLFQRIEFFCDKIEWVLVQIFEICGPIFEWRSQISNIFSHLICPDDAQLVEILGCIQSALVSCDLFSCLKSQQFFTASQSPESGRHLYPKAGRSISYIIKLMQ